MNNPVRFHFLELEWIASSDDRFEEAAHALSGRIAPRDAWRILSSLSLLADLDATNLPDSGAYSGHLVRDILYQCIWEALGLHRATVGDPQVATVEENIRRRFAEPLRLADLAAEASLSPSQLTRRFRRAFGVTPVQQLTHIRLREAARLLTAGDATLDEIASRCGYSNGFYLSRVFTQHMGVPPSVYRREHSI